MKVLKLNYDLNSRSAEWWLDLYSDTHLGSKSVAERKLASDIKETLHANHYAVHLGDCIDGVLPGDRRFEPSNLTDWAWDALQRKCLIQAEWDKLYDAFKPLVEADKLLFVLSGDGKHNEFRYVSDCMEQKLRDMGVPGGYPALHLILTFYRTGTSAIRVELVFHHGFFAGRRDMGKVGNLQLQLLYYPHATGWFCGHGHNKVSTRVNGLVIEGKEQVEWVRRAAMTGSYLRTYADDTVGYGEVKGYAPSAIGHISICLRPFHCDPERRITLHNL